MPGPASAPMRGKRKGMKAQAFTTAPQIDISGIKTARMPSSINLDSEVGNRTSTTLPSDVKRIATTSKGRPGMGRYKT